MTPSVLRSVKKGMVVMHDVLWEFGALDMQHQGTRLERRGGPLYLFGTSSDAPQYTQHIQTQHTHTHKHTQANVMFIRIHWIKGSAMETNDRLLIIGLWQGEREGGGTERKRERESVTHFS